MRWTRLPSLKICADLTGVSWGKDEPSIVTISRGEGMGDTSVYVTARSQMSLDNHESVPLQTQPSTSKTQREEEENALSRKHRRRPKDDSSWLQVLYYELAWPITGSANLVISVSLVLALLYGLLVSLVGCRALPPIGLVEGNATRVAPRPQEDGDFFALFALLLFCLLCGALARVARLPGLLGMLVGGLLCRNVPGLSVLGLSLNAAWVSGLRQTAFVLILLQGGLSLDLRALRSLAGVVVRLAFVPCIVEASTVAVASNLIFGLPPLYGCILGFVLGAVSPAVCVPCMVWLESKGLGRDSGIGSLVIAASSLDDVLAITSCSVLLSIAFAQGEIWWIILKGPLDLLAGVAFGLIGGVLLWFFPSLDNPRTTLLRSLSLGLGGTTAMLGSAAVGMGGSGAIGALVLAVTAAHGWTNRDGDDGASKESVSGWVGLGWTVLEPALFGLIGASVDVVGSGLGGARLGSALGVLCVGLTMRTLAAFFAVGCAGFAWRERLFISLAWLPKATVQAAMGPLVLDAAMTGGKPEVQAFGRMILAVAVLSILVTAPLGAALIVLTGPQLLHKRRADTHDP